MRGLAAARGNRDAAGHRRHHPPLAQRSSSPYVGEIATIAATLGYPGIWFLNGCYEWGCTALAREQAGAPWLARTLDWPFPGLGRYLEVARMQGPAGDVRQCRLARICRRADRVGARPICRRHQSGAAAAPDAPSVAAALRHGAQCGAYLAHSFHPAGPSAAQRVRDLRELWRGQASAGNDADRAAGDLFAGRLRSRASDA